MSTQIFLSLNWSIDEMCFKSIKTGSLRRHQFAKIWKFFPDFKHLQKFSYKSSFLIYTLKKQFSFVIKMYRWFFCEKIPLLIKNNSKKSAQNFFIIDFVFLPLPFLFCLISCPEIFYQVYLAVRTLCFQFFLFVWFPTQNFLTD